MASWRRLGIEETQELARFAEIMRGMDERYAKLDARTAQSMMVRKGGEVYLFRDTECELVLCFLRSARTGRVYVWSAGYAGKVEREVAMERAAEQIIEVMRAHGVAAVYAIRPYTMDHAPMQEMHELFGIQGHMKVTVEAESTATALWRLEPLAGLAPAREAEGPSAEQRIPAEAGVGSAAGRWFGTGGRTRIVRCADDQGE